MALALATLLGAALWAGPAPVAPAEAGPTLEAPAGAPSAAPTAPSGFGDLTLDPRPNAGPQPQPAPYSLELSEAQVRRPEADYKLTARRWRDMVREDPELWYLHKRGRLVVPGAIFLSISGVWLSISTAVAIDFQDHGLGTTATEALFQWVFPSALLVSGAVMTTIGVRARRDLRAAQRRLMVSPYTAQGATGLMVGGRF